MKSSSNEKTVDLADEDTDFKNLDTLKFTDPGFLELIEQLGDLAFFKADFENRKLICSPNFQKIFGLEKSINQLSHFRERVHPDDHERVISYWEDCLNNGKDFRCDYKLLRDDGHTVYVFVVTKIFYENERPELGIGIVQDITKRKVYEYKLKELISELKETRDSFISSIAHDLKAPVDRIKGLSTLLRKDLDPQTLGIITHLENSADLALNFINELTEAASLDEKDLDIEKEALDFTELVKRSIEEFKIKAREKNIRLDVKFNSGKINIQANRTKILRLVNNLISNAIKFSHDNSLISIRVFKDNEYAIFNIKDHGLGMSKEQLKTVFSRFSKFRRSGTHGEPSTGLGMNIVKKIVDLHNGKIKVESEERKGTFIEIALPFD